MAHQNLLTSVKISKARFPPKRRVCVNVLSGDEKIRLSARMYQQKLCGDKYWIEWSSDVCWLKGKCALARAGRGAWSVVSTEADWMTLNSQLSISCLKHISPLITPSFWWTLNQISTINNLVTFTLIAYKVLFLLQAATNYAKCVCTSQELTTVISCADT